MYQIRNTLAVRITYIPKDREKSILFFKDVVIENTSIQNAYDKVLALNIKKGNLHNVSRDEIMCVIREATFDEDGDFIPGKVVYSTENQAWWNIKFYNI
jgi:hypothetical protein